MKKLLTLVVLFAGMSPSLRAQTYTFSQSTAPYENLSNPIALSGGMPWDEENFEMPLAFPFVFNGQGYATVEVNANGMIRFQNDTVVFIAFAADLIDRGITTSESPISYSVEGLPGNQIQKVEFRNAGFFEGAPSDSINFQIWFYESDYSIETRVGPGSIDDEDAAYDGAAGPIVGVFVLNEMLEPVYTLALTGPADAANSTTWNGLTEPPTVTGTPVEGTVYRFEQSLGACGFIAAIAPPHVTLCPGANATVTAIPTGDAYQWYKDDVLISGATNSTYAVTNADANSVFTVTVTLNACADTSSATAVESITSLETTIEQYSQGFVDASGAVHVCPGEFVIALVTATSDATLQWFMNDQLIPDQTDVYLPIFQSGMYTAVATSVCPGFADTTAPLKVYVEEPAPVITMMNDTLYTDIEATSYQWQYEGSDIPGATNAFHAPADFGAFTVTVTFGNDNCAGTSAPFVFSGISSTHVKRMAVFPNPVAEELTLSISNLNTVDYTVHDALGRVVMKGKMTERLNVTILTPGVYTLTVDHGSAAYRSRFVKE